MYIFLTFQFLCFFTKRSLKRSKGMFFVDNSSQNWSREVQLVSFCTWQNWLQIIIIIILALWGQRSKSLTVQKHFWTYLHPIHHIARISWLFGSCGTCQVMPICVLFRTKWSKNYKWKPKTNTNCKHLLLGNIQYVARNLTALRFTWVLPSLNLWFGGQEAHFSQLS